MTVGTTTPRVEYIEDGHTTVHPIPFQFFDHEELLVTRIDGTSDVNNHTLALGVDYTVAGGAGEVGSITKATVGTLGATLRIQRNTRRSQLLDYEPGDDFPAEMHEEGLDRLEMQIQELADGALSVENVRDIIGRTLVAGNGIQIVVNDEANTITISTIAADALIDGLPDCVMLSGDQQTWDGTTGTGSGGLSEEDVQDIVADMIKAGASISVAYDDASNTFTITNTSPGGGGGGGLDAEGVMDVVAGMLSAGTGIDLNYNDAGNALEIAATGGGGGGGGLSVSNQNLVANGGHVTLSNGLILQWGKVDVPGDGTPTVYFPVPYTAFAIPVGSGGYFGPDQPDNCRIFQVSLSNFKVVNNDGDHPTAPFWWISIGV
jgi:hypothetical protein